MTGAERIDLRSLAPQAWKNGAGLTREIAVGGTDAVDFDWRISLAEVERDAPFSAFPGIDRCIVLLRGAGMGLRALDGRLDHSLTEPLAPFYFPGELAIEATLAGGASSDFNVMTRRGVFRSELSGHRSPAHLQGGDITLVLGCTGQWQLGVEAPLAPMQALLWREPILAIEARPLEPDSALLLVRLCHDRQG